MSKRSFPRSTRVAPRGLFAISLVTLCAACGSGAARNPFDPTAPVAGQTQIRIEVQNLNFNDASVFALRAGQRIRVGRVTGKSDQNFTVDWDLAQSIAFQVDIVGGRTCRTSEVVIAQEARVWLTIPSDMGLGVCRAGRR